MILSRWPSVPTALLAIALSACGSGDTSSDSQDDSNRETEVIATTSIWADITSAVGCGEPISSLIPSGADPHTFEPSLRDRELIDRSNTIISNGLGLEDSLVDLLDTARDDDVTVIEMTNHVEILTDDESDDSNERDSDDHDHDPESNEGDSDDHDHDPESNEGGADDHDHGGGGDPHVWQDPLRVAGTLDTLASVLTANDIGTCTDAYRDELVALDAEIDEILTDVPETSRILVTSHDSLAYFADRYGFEVVGTVIPSTSTLAETNAADLADLAAVIDAHDIPAIFTEQLESTADADALAGRLGVAVVPLVTDSLTADPATDTYVEMLRHNARAIVQALAL